MDRTVNQTEKKMIHDAMAEVMTRLDTEPAADRRDLQHFAAGMRHLASVLGMPEGSAHYDWAHNQPTTEGIPIKGLRATRREQLLRALTRR